MLEAGIDTWAAAMVRAAWQGGLAILVMGAVGRLVPAIPAGVRCWMWRLVYLKLGLALLGAASVNLPVLPGERVAVSGPAAAVASAPVGAPHGVGSISRVGQSVPEREGPGQPRRPWLVAAFAAWLAGVAGCLVRLLLQWRRLGRLKVDCVPARSPELLSLRAELCRVLGIRQEPEIVVSHRIERPMLVGGLRGEIVLPGRLVEQGSFEELRLVLAHELGHLKRCDLPWAWLPAAACTLLWYHPLVWLAAVEWHHAHEAACDELTLQCTAASPAAYGSLLLQLSTRPAPAQLAALSSVGIVGSYASLERRLVALRAPGQKTTWRTGVAVGLAGVALLGLMPWRAVAAETVSYLDLGLVANQPLDASMGSGKHAGNDLAALPRGRQVFGGLRFEVGDRCLQLAGSLLPERPRSAERIAVGRRFSTLAILHSTVWGSAEPGKAEHVPDGTPVAEYRVHYADGRVETIPVIYGEDLRDWWRAAEPTETPATRATVAWTGENAATRPAGIRLYAMTWENPRPGSRVSHLELVSLGAAAAPFCVAITCGD